MLQISNKAETRLSLITLQAALGLTTLDQIIAKAIEVEDRARLQDQPQTQQEDDDNSTSPMDIDNFQKYSNKASVNIAHLVKLAESKLPRTKLVIQQRPCISLWDTGAEISGISKLFTETIGVAINKNTSIPYLDVNGNINNTCVTVELTFGDIAFNVHVIEDLAHDLIIGWDTITALQGQVDAKTQSVTIRINDTTTTIPTIKDTQMINAIETQVKATEDITNMILNEYKDVIAENPNKPKVAHLVEFEIDTGDHEPIFEKPRTFHPIMEQQIDQRLEEMCQDGIMTKISFSRWASKVRPVEKPDGSTRICGNYSGWKNGSNVFVSQL
ncbi:hypothetical protein G6F37_012656 [Rhizopus arrhizus]|nr:hypothetical protein G6F38_012636 [Rhizopus arrhizus]KAG1142347.1 hypothetical protein G6F37_012656 [Rhizopus arrhizus]